jgi:hypothetical protein
VDVRLAISGTHLTVETFFLQLLINFLLVEHKCTKQKVTFRHMQAEWNARGVTNKQRLAAVQVCVARIRDSYVILQGEK